MTVQVRYFASIRELVGRSEQEVKSGQGRTAREIWNKTTGLPLPANILVAINQEYAKLDAPVNDGDEIAFFPPVTGG